MNKFLLLGAPLNTNNLGVAALAAGTVTALRANLPNIQVKLLDYGRTPQVHTIQTHKGPVEVELVNIRHAKCLHRHNCVLRLILLAVLLKCIPFVWFRKIIFSHNYIIREIIDADKVGSLAGGDSFSDIYGLERLLYVALPQILVLLLQKPLLLLPQTHGPFRGRFAKKIARYILERAEIIYSRDMESLEEIKLIARNCQSSCLFSNDMAFVMCPSCLGVNEPEWTTAHNGRLIGFNVSGLLSMGGYTHDNMFHLKVDYRQLVISIIQYFIQKHKAIVVLVPHVHSSAGNPEGDTAICQELYYTLRDRFPGHIYCIEERYDQHQIKYLIGKFDFFLGSRMHACIAALSQGIPAVGLAYSRKFRGVFRSVGMEDLAIDLRNIDEDSVISIIDRLYTERSTLQASIMQEIINARSSVFSIFSISYNK